MSLPLNFGSRWESATLAVTGAATASVLGEVLTCTSAVGESAKITRYVRLAPGETLRFACLARRVSGVDDTAGGMLISVSGTKDRIRVTNTNSFAEYVVSYTHPLTSAAAAFVGIECGVFTADAGTVQFTKPRIDIVNAQLGANRTVACGLITLAAGVPSINSGFATHGIRALAYEAAAKKLTVTMDRSSGAAFSSPLPFAQMTYDGNGMKVNPKPGGYNAAAGTVGIMFADNTGVAVDIATLGTMFMWFKAEV